MTHPKQREAHFSAAPETWHTQGAPRVLEVLGSSVAEGLTAARAAALLAEHGPNELRAGHRVSALALLFEQCKNVLIIILLGAAILSGFLGHGVEAIVIAVIVIFAILLGFVQEYRAERAIEALKKMAAPTATVVRDGQEMEIPARDVVPGDIILLGAGDKVPADARMIESVSLQADEASLTGESVPVSKIEEAIPDPKAAVGDRKNMVFAGTSVTYGRGRAVVVATGMQTEFGQIAGMLQDVESGPTPLQKNLDKVGGNLGKAALVIVTVISVIGFYRGQPLLEMFIFAIALAVAVVPEALPAVVTISLAIGVQKMVKRHALIRRLPAVETLGSTSVICSDKTGTLTKDEMTAVRIWTAGETFEVTGAGYAPKGEFRLGGKKIEPAEALKELLTAGTQASDTHLINTEEGWDIKGDPTEGALVVAAAKAGLDKRKLDEQFPRTGEIPFTSETKRMTTLHRTPEGDIAYAKGAPEILLSSCTMIRTDKGEKKLTEEDREAVLDAAKAMADGALRVLGIARKNDTTLPDAEADLTFLGLVGMIDPPRPEAKEAIARCHGAGIRVIMITGDHPVTAKAVARELGLLKGGEVITGAEFDQMDDEEFKKHLGRIDVFARVSPAHKLRVVSVLQAQGEVVAMTGDGVNDAPALKKADIGIAMGITGTDVTKEAAAMTLTDDNFASIVAAVEEGRGIFGNIKKYLMYLLSSNIGEICIMGMSAAMGLPLPLSAVQILYVNLATDGLPALALAVDRPERDLMSRAPRDPRRSIFTRPVIALMLTGGLWSMVINVLLFRWALQSGRSVDEAMSMIFVCLVLIEFFKAYCFRSDRNTAFRSPFSNKWLNLSILWEIVLLLLVLYVPFLQHAFGTYALPIDDWLIIGLLAATVVPVLEMAKWMVRRRVFGETV